MRRPLLGGLLLLLAACSTSQPTPKIPLSPADLDPHQGIVVFGLSVTGGQPNGLGVYPGVRGYWIAYDPATGQRIGKDTWAMNTGNGIFMADDMKSGATGYRFLKLPPGDYAIGFMRDVTDKVMVNYMLVAGTLQQLYSQSLTGARAELGDPILQPDAKVLPTTPRFHIGAGEVIYIGDLDFDVGDRFGLHFSLGQNETAARAFAATGGEAAAERMISRPIAHADGSPIGRPDVIATVGSSQIAAGSPPPPAPGAGDVAGTVALGALGLVRTNTQIAPPATTARAPSAAVDASTAGAAVSAFGLVGTWSTDCAKDVGDGSSRITFAVPASGAPTAVSESRALRTHFTILSAERVGNDQLHLTLDATRIEAAANVVKTSAAAGQQIDQLLEKTGDKYQIKQSRRVGGDVTVKDGVLVQASPPIPAPMMAKCGAP